MTPSFKTQVKATRQEVKDLFEKWGTLHAAILAQIPSDERMNITTDLGKLQWHHLEDVNSAFFAVKSALHNLWSTFPELVKDNPQVEAALRQAMKDFHGQPFVFDEQLEWTVEQARESIHAMQHAND